jgi:uncharacterized protein (DUF1330 family)
MNEKAAIYTQLIYLLPGQENAFNEFEDSVLALLPTHKGKLLLRTKTIGSVGEFPAPDEIHIVEFESEADFHAYVMDPRRQQILHKKEQAIKQVILFEGRRIQ